MQHNVQEFLRVLLDKLETKMERTCTEGKIFAIIPRREKRTASLLGTDRSLSGSIGNFTKLVANAQKQFLKTIGPVGIKRVPVVPFVF